MSTAEALDFRASDQTKTEKDSILQRQINAEGAERFPSLVLMFLFWLTVI